VPGVKRPGAKSWTAGPGAGGATGPGRPASGFAAPPAWPASLACGRFDGSWQSDSYALRGARVPGCPGCRGARRRSSETRARMGGLTVSRLASRTAVRYAVVGRPIDGLERRTARPRSIGASSRTCRVRAIALSAGRSTRRQWAPLSGRAGVPFGSPTPRQRPGSSAGKRRGWVARGANRPSSRRQRRGAVCTLGPARVRGQVRGAAAAARIPLPERRRGRISPRPSAFGPDGLAFGSAEAPAGGSSIRRYRGRAFGVAVFTDVARGVAAGR